MAFPNNFSFHNCIPKEEDFKIVLECKKTGNNYRLYHEHDGSLEAIIRIFIAAVLLQYTTVSNELKRKLTSKSYSGWGLADSDLKQLFNTLLLPGYKNSYYALYLKYKDLNVENPEVRTKQARDARKGLIELNVKNQNAAYFRIISYSMNYGSENPNKAQTGARRHLYFGKKNGNIYQIVVRGTTIRDKTHFDEPVFATIQEARDFIDKAKQNPMGTKTDLSAWRYVISDKPIEYGWDHNTQKPLKITDLSKAFKVNTICGPAYIFQNSKYCEEALKGSNNMNILNEAKLDYYEQLRKMQQLDNGTRGFNVGAASYEKIRYNYNICIKEKLLHAKAYIENELRKCGNLRWIQDLMFKSLPKFTSQDFHYADYAFVRDHPINDLVGKDVYYTFIYLVFAMLQKKHAEADTLKDELINVHKVSLQNIKDTINKLLSDQKVKDGLYQIANFKESNESLDEGTEKVKDGKWVNKGKEGTHGTFKTKKAADAQRKAMFANGYHENLNVDMLVKLLNNAKYANLNKYLKEETSYLDAEKKFRDYGTADAKDLDIIDINKASSFGAQELLNNTIDSAYENLVYDIINITPQQYFELCSKIQNATVEDLKDWIKYDTSRLQHLQDVLLKYHKKFPIPYISFASDEILGQEGKHRMYVIGELFGWDKKFPVMIIQNRNNRKSLDQLLNEQKENNLNEKVEKHDTLNPKLFDANNKLLPEVREKLLAIVKEFTDGLEEDEIKFNLEDIKIVGSNCSYNYNDSSDLDLHVVAETNSLNCPDNLYPLLYSAYRSIFNNKFDPVIHGIPVELFVETEETEQVDNKEEITEERQKSALNSAGIYSVLNDKWIKEPEQADIPEINQAELDKLVQPWIDRYNEIKLNPTVESIEKYITDIYELRKQALGPEGEGEYSFSNLIFKEIRGLGYLDDLKVLKNELKSKELSLESLEERLDERTRREYRIKISQIAHNQAIVDGNNNFSIHLVKESDVDQIMRGLRQLDFVYDLNKIAGKFDFSHPIFTGIQPRYWTIRGRIKEKEDL